MGNKINGISLDYEDALIRIFCFHMNNSSKEDISVFHEHKFYEIHFAVEGSHEYLLGNRSISLSAGQLLIIPPNVPHVSIIPDHKTYKFYALSIHLSKKSDEENFYAYFKKILDKFSMRPICSPNLLLKQTETLCRPELYSSVKGNCQLKSAASTFIYELFSSLDQFSAAPSLNYVCDETARDIFIKELVNNPFYKLSEISEAIGYSPRHTARLINEIYGKSLSQIRKEQKNFN